MKLGHHFQGHRSKVNLQGVGYIEAAFRIACSSRTVDLLRMLLPNMESIFSDKPLYIREGYDAFAL